MLMLCWGNRDKERKKPRKKPRRILKAIMQWGAPSSSVIRASDLRTLPQFDSYQHEIFSELSGDWFYFFQIQWKCIDCISLTWNSHWPQCHLWHYGQSDFSDYLYMPNVVHVVAYLHGFDHIYPGYLMAPMFPNTSKVQISNDFLRCFNESFEILD